MVTETIQNDKLYILTIFFSFIFKAVASTGAPQQFCDPPKGVTAGGAVAHFLQRQHEFEA